MIVKSWKLMVDKTGILMVSYLNVRGMLKTVNPKSDKVTVTNSGIELDFRNGDTLMYLECPFKGISLKDRQPLPVVKMLELGTFDDAAVRRLRSHILGFVYEFVAGVCFEKNPVIVKKPPFNIDVLLAEYSQFAGQLGTIDWQAVADNFL